ncbi:MAG: PAS domain-containing protein [Mariniphaga sp.]
MSDTSALRNKAEALLRARQPEPVPILTESELLRIVHELEVHQIELEMVNEELFFQNQEIGKREEELIVLNSKLDTNLELLEANTKLKLLTEERLKIAEELIIANKELVFQSKEKEKRAVELFVANKELLFQNNEKAQQAKKLILANIELLFQNDEKAKRAAELILANKELLLLNDENAKLSVELLLANKELIFQNDEKTLRADELIIANIELLFQNDEKEKRADELLVVNKLVSFQRDRLEEIASLVPGVVFQYRQRPDGSSYFPYASEAIKQIYRVTPEDVCEDASRIYANLHPDDYDGVMASIQTSATNLTPWQHEYRVKFDDGTIQTLFGNSIPRLEKDGSVLWHGFVTDITGQKLTEEKLKQSEESFRNVVALSPMASIVRRNTKIIYANPAALLMFGVKNLPEMEGSSILDWLHPDFHEIVKMRTRNVIASGLPAPKIEIQYLRHDGTIGDTEVQSTPIIYDGLPSIHVSLNDISERKRMENLLKENNSRLAIAMQMAKMAWWEIDVVTGTINFDDKEVEMLGLSPTNLNLTKDFANFLHPDDLGKVMNVQSDYLSGQLDKFEVEYRILTQSGEYKWFFNKGTIIKRDEHGMPLYLSGFVIDITERKEKEVEIKMQNEKLQKIYAEKDKFFSIIAHDLRGPVGGLMGLTGMMADENENFTDNEIKEMTFDLNRSARNTFNLLENLLEWSQMDRGLTEFQPQNLALTEVVTDCKNVVLESARGKGIELFVDIPSEYNVIADKNMVQTVIRNLFSNAIKFTPKGGRVTISAKPADNSMMEISVSDTGIGMSDQLVNDLFLIDTNTKRPGTEGEQSTGLGLLLCKEFVEKHGGKFSVESDQNYGTVFSFTIPSIGPHGNEIANQKVELTTQFAGKISNLKILIAEDDDISARLIHAMVKGISREIFYAKNGNAAVDICRNNTDIDLVMMDIAMPGMDGYEATRQIRQFNQEVVIIAQTTFALSADRQRAFEAGFNGFISKPLGKEALIELIKKHLSK